MRRGVAVALGLRRAGFWRERACVVTSSLRRGGAQFHWFVSRFQCGSAAPGGYNHHPESEGETTHLHEHIEQIRTCRFAQRSNDAARLLARIHRRYETVTQTLRIGSLQIPFTRIKEPDRVLDEACAEEDRREKLKHDRRPNDELSLPYWAELWDSAIGVGQFLDRVHRSGLRGRHERTRPRALDLGCGMGLAGAVAARLGYEATLGDLERAALLFAQLNTIGYRSRVRVRRIDWRVDRLAEKFELIIGSDLLYDRAQWEFLDPFWRHHLDTDGEIILGEPGRQTGELFVDWIRSRGWALEEFSEMSPMREKPIRIFRLTS